jgi:membrane protease subunit (stomatin/prohibitin family)
VFYINSEVTLLCKWGTPNTFKIIDPFLKVPVNVGAHGSFDVHVTNSRKFMLKMVGDKQGLTTEGLRRFFADKMVMRVKDVLANAMVTTGINAYELPTKLVAISEAIISSVEHIFDDYGVEIKNFSINDIHIPSEDTRVLEDIIKKKRILEMQDKSFKSEEEKQRQNAQFNADMTVKLAEIEAKKEPTKINININGVPQARFCPECGKKVEGKAKFCPHCGNQL